MNSSKKCLTSVIFGLILISLSGCRLLSSTTATGATILAENHRNSSESSASQVELVSQETTPSNTIKITLYQVDSQCEKLVPETVNIPSKNSLETVIGEVITTFNNGDFSVAGYRVQVDQKSGVATIDLRLPPDTKRKFMSLSTCEMLALFGSLRQTLTSNSQWHIKEVRFTEKGQEIFH
jgi:hypothetical protein